MSKILISYRREDSVDVTGRIYDRLIQEFGSGTIFKDVDSIPPGVDFRKYLDAQVAKCEVFLAVIGREWMKKRGSKGKSRLEDPGDFVRIEVESALKRDIPVIPVLVSGAAIPPIDQLPPSLHDLSYRHGVVVRPDPDFHRDMDRLIEFLKQATRERVDQRTEPSITVQTVSGHLKEKPSPASEEKLEPLPEERPHGAGGAKPSRKTVEAEKPARRQASTQSQKTARQEAPFEMVKVPKGPFLYGDGKTRVVIDHDYWIHQYPVTNEKYRVFIEAGGYENKKYWSDNGWKWKTENSIACPDYWDDRQFNEPAHPVVGISYYEAEAYAKWADKRLPTEQEWEKAARGEDGREYPWGEKFDKTRCNSDKSHIGHTTPVAQYPNGMSPYGCYDMAGNVWEWCAGGYDEKFGQCVLRGGSWNASPESLCASNRLWLNTDDQFNIIGFRLVQDIP